MNDDDLITAVRQGASGVRMSVPTERIISRSHQIRAGRRLRAAAAVLATATVLVVAVMALANPAPTRSSPVRLTAWTVVSRPDGVVAVTIRELRDPAGLARRLRADGIPASITYHGYPNTACRLYPADGWRYARVFPPIIRGRSRPAKRLYGLVPPRSKRLPPGDSDDGFIAIWIPALPRGAGVQFGATVRHGRLIISAPKLVYAKPACTAVYKPSR
jgi:hypothetical protein